MNTSMNFFTFRLLNTWLSIKPEHVVTILDPQQYIPIPLAPEHVIGLVSYGQTILPVFHLSLFLKMLDIEKDDISQSRLLIIKIKQLEVAIPIHQTAGIERVPETGLRSSILIKNGNLQKFLSHEYDGIEGLTGVLNMEQVLELARV